MKLLYPLLIFPFSPLSGQVLLFKDTFDAPNTNNLDLSDQTGRRSGLTPDIQIRSSRVQHGIIGNQLDFRTVRTGRIRFHNDPDNDTATAGTWHDWATGTTGSEITTGGGLRIEFDWIAGDDTSDDWIAVSMGIGGVGEPGFRVNHVETDLGILLRFNGNTQVFDGGVNIGAQGSSPNTIGARHIVLDYTFNSFADGSNVNLVASVDGAEVFNGTGFTWDNNLGELYFEIGTLQNTLLDNVAISAANPNVYRVNLDGSIFGSGVPQGTPIGDLAGSAGSNPDPSTFSLVPGIGDTDNDKFQITDNILEVGNFDFTGENSVEGQEYSVRIQGVGSGTTERIFTIVLYKDEDNDNLRDSWENTWSDDLADLSAILGTEDFDLDGIPDADEYLISIGAYNGGSTPYPNIDPTQQDTDNDSLLDGEEINPTGTRPATDPTNNDTDLDGLSDKVETNSMMYVNASNTGTDPTKCDTDGDFASDPWEITYNTNPFDPGNHPGPIGPVTIVPITDDASTGLNPAKGYSHLISGGQAVTLNGVTLEALTPTMTPANLTWDTMGASMSALTDRPGEWDPVAASASPELQALLSSFTYSGNGTGPGNSQRFTLSNLTPGTNYDLRLYIRSWVRAGSGRPIDLFFTNGTEVVQPFNSLPEDRPGLVTGSGNDNDAYYLSYQYVAQGTELVIDAVIPLCSSAVSGSMHLYALTNEISTGVPPGQILITNQVLMPSGEFVITFKANPQTTYQVTKSSDLASGFVPLDVPLNVTTTINGQGQATIPIAETANLKEFYRIEQ